MKRTAWQSAVSLIIFCVILCLLSGCAWSIGEHKEHGVPTRGQELIDIKKARDLGAITEEEYQAQRKRLLEK